MNCNLHALTPKIAIMSRLRYALYLTGETCTFISVEMLVNYYLSIQRVGRFDGTTHTEVMQQGDSNPHRRLNFSSLIKDKLQVD